MKTLQEDTLWTPEQVEEKKAKELYEIALEVLRRYTTTLGTILVDAGGTFDFNPLSTLEIEGKHVDFTIEYLEEEQKIRIHLIVDGKPWGNAYKDFQEETKVISGE